MCFIKTRINGREYTFFSWAEFATATAKIALQHTVEILDIREPKGVANAA